MNIQGMPIHLAWANSFFEKWNLSDFFAIQYASRAQSGFQFLADIIDPDNTLSKDASSAPISRQIYILISYNFELLLDSAVCASSIMETEAELDKLVKVNHQLGTLWGRVTKKDIRKLMQIKKIKPPSVKDIFENFKITLKTGEVITIPEFTDIRYDVADFRGRKESTLRSTADQQREMRSAIHTFAFMAKKMTSYLYSKYPK